MVYDMFPYRASRYGTLVAEPGPTLAERGQRLVRKRHLAFPGGSPLQSGQIIGARSKHGGTRYHAYSMVPYLHLTPSKRPSRVRQHKRRGASLPTGGCEIMQPARRPAGQWINER